MVERVWSARTTRQNAAAYRDYFERVVVPELEAVHGYQGFRLLQRQTGDTEAIEIVVVTRWESLDVIRGFAGNDIERAVVHDRAAALFTDYDRTVRHFEVVLERS